MSVGNQVSAAALPNLRFHGHLSTEQLDRQLFYATSLLSSSRDICVDLSATRSFDVVALLQLLATVAARQRSDLETRFRLPTDEYARHMLRLWQFPLAVTTLTGTPFRLLVHPRDSEYFGEDWPDLPDLVAASASPRSNVLAYLMERKWFGLRAYSLDNQAERLRMLDAEVEHWSRYPLSELLQLMLKGPASDIVRVLVQELTTNVLKEPTPRTAVVGCQVELSDHSHSAQGEDGGTLTLGVWNSGDSAVKALRERLTGSGRTTPQPSERGDEFVVQASGWNPSREVYDGHWHPDADAEDPEILIAGLIASAPVQASASAQPKGTTDLYALYKTTIDTFRGSLAIRSEGTSLHISGDPDHDGARYRVLITAGRQLPVQQGTVIAIRIPVHDA